MRGLARHLTYDHFRTLFSAKDSSIIDNLGWGFHYDIIAELPVEISQKIFLYLPLQQCFKAQRVSRRWRKLLSAPQTMERLIRWWYPRGDMDLCIPDGLSIEAIINLKAEHIDAFRTGYPFSKSTLVGVPDHSPTPPVGSIAYARGVLAWIHPDPSDRISRSIGRSIETLDLKTHLRRHFIAEDRTSFHTIAMSSTIIAALDHAGRCHVWNISHSDKICLLQLPSAGYDRLEASGPALAIASSSQDRDGKIEVFTWSSQSRKTQSFLLQLQPLQSGFGREWKITLEPRGESLLLFQRIFRKRVFGVRGISDFQPEQQDGFYFTRASLDGQICAQGQYKCLSGMCGVPSGREYLGKIRTVEVNGSATLWLFHSTNYGPYNNDAGETGLLEIIRICFNFEESSFKVEERKFADTSLYHSNTSILSIWKDILYWGDPADTNSRIIDFRESTCEMTKLSRKWAFDLCEGDAKHVFMDETFFIHVLPKGWTVWCFDKNIQMANEDLEYGEARSRGRLWLSIA